MGEMIKLGGLWKNTTKDNKTYLGGGFTYGSKILIFPNSFKEEGNNSQPDYVMYLAPADKKEEAKEDEKPENEEIPF